MKKIFELQPLLSTLYKHLYLGTIILRMHDSLLTSHEEYKILKKYIMEKIINSV